MTQSQSYRRLVRLAGSMNTKALRVGVPGRLTVDDLMLLEDTFTVCPYCGIGLRPGEGQFDHVVPFSRGGPNTRFNVIVCCRSCNRQKYTKTPNQHVDYVDFVVNCQVCDREFHPRFGEWEAGRGRLCSRRCAANKRWHGVAAS